MALTVNRLSTFRDLDAEVFQSKFDRSMRDSGAIVVGAGAPPSGTHGPDRSRLDFSNWGSIVDSQGWGEGVTTTGGFFDGAGDLQGGKENQWYTQRFSGTSSASSRVAPRAPAQRRALGRGSPSPT